MWDFVIQIDHRIPAIRLDQLLVNKKKRNCHLVNFGISADHRVKFIEGENLDKYLDLIENWKGCGIRQRQWYQSLLEPLERTKKNLEKSLR